MPRNFPNKDESTHSIFYSNLQFENYSCDLFFIPTEKICKNIKHDKSYIRLMLKNVLVRGLE